MLIKVVGNLALFRANGNKSPPFLRSRAVPRRIGVHGAGVDKPLPVGKPGNDDDASVWSGRAGANEAAFQTVVAGNPDQVELADPLDESGRDQKFFCLAGGDA